MLVTTKTLFQQPLRVGQIVFAPAPPPSPIVKRPR